MSFTPKYLTIWASVGFGLFFFSVSSALAANSISLGTAQSFGVLGASAITNTGSTVVTGDLGISPGTSITGFPPGSVTGTTHNDDAVATEAQSDATTAYNAILGTACTTDLTGQNLGGLTLTPGVYCFSSSAQLTGTLTLNALGNPNALFIFKIGSTLTTASGSVVQVINPASACNVFWQVGSSATLGAGTSFVGNILAETSITLTTGANVVAGRLLALTGAVTLETDDVTVCGPTIPCPVITLSPATLPNGVAGTPYSQTISGVGGVAPYTFTLASGALPSGLMLNTSTGAISGTPSGAGTFNFIITATDANGCPGSQPYSIVITGAASCPVITVNPATLPPGPLGMFYSQSVTAVGGTSPYTFTISSGTLPPGLTLGTGNTSSVLISGTPLTPGLFTFTITATDAHGCPGSRPYSIVIPVLSLGPGVCPVITVNPTTLLNAVLGTPYSQTISAVGGTAPYTFALLDGALPLGLTLNGTTGVISGTPLVLADVSFTIIATDANGCQGSRNYAFIVQATGSSPPPSATVPTLSEWGAILMALLIVAAGVFFMVGNGKTAVSLSGAASSTGFSGTDKGSVRAPGAGIDWKLLARTAIYVEAGIALALLVLSAKPVDTLGALASGILVAFILHLLISGARRR
jgi:hypothetical protein